MSRAVAFFAIVLAFVMAALPVGAAEFGTRDEALAMVRRVQQKFKKEGAEAAFNAINSLCDRIDGSLRCQRRHAGGEGKEPA